MIYRALNTVLSTVGAFYLNNQKKDSVFIVELALDVPQKFNLTACMGVSDTCFGSIINLDALE
jgi:hypothetical protein